MEKKLFIRMLQAVDDVEYPVVVLERSNHPSQDGNDGQCSGRIVKSTRHQGQDCLEYSTVSSQPSREGVGCTRLEKKAFQIKRWHDEEGNHARV